jgi:transposase
MNKQGKGRPIKLTPEIQDRIVQAVKAGNYIETASAYAGIAKSTLYEWLKKGTEEEKGPFYEFSNAIKKALAEAEMRDVAIIDEVAKNGNWTASAWRLERKFPERWGRKDSLKAEVNSNHTETTEVKIDHSLTADPESKELIKQLWRRKQALEVGDQE